MSSANALALEGIVKYTRREKTGMKNRYIGRRVHFIHLRERVCEYAVKASLLRFGSFRFNTEKAIIS